MASRVIDRKALTALSILLSLALAIPSAALLLAAQFTVHEFGHLLGWRI